MSFRVYSKTFLLTYSQCDLPKDAVKEYLNSISELDEYCIGQEHHQDGNLHIHAWIKFKTKYQSRNPRCFDINGFHPNIMTARSKKGSIAYVSKEDTDPLQNIKDDKLTYSEIFDKATTSKEFMSLVLQNHARDYANNYDRLISMSKNHYKPEPVQYTPKYKEFRNLPMDMLTININDTDRPRTLIIHGESRLGKTQWARSLGKHIYSRGCIIYDDFIRDSPTAEYAVFDDLWDWNYRFLKDFIGAQQTVTITGKYRKPVQLNWSRRSIFLTNEKFWEQWSQEQQSYLQANSTIITLKNKLY